jgi:hypothetical protein
MEHEPNIPPLDRVGENLRAAIAAKEARRPHRRRLMLASVATGLAVALLATSMIVERVGGHDGLSVDEAVAAVARAAFDQPRVNPPGVLYTKVRMTNISGVDSHGRFQFNRPRTELRETWTRRGEKKGWLRFTDADPSLPLKPRQHVHTLTCRSVLAPMFAAMGSDFALVPNIKKVPTTPAKAYEFLRRHIPGGYIGAGGNDTVVWMSVSAVMGGGAPQLSPAQRAAVVGALAKIPGVTTMGETTDPLGNPAIGFSRTVTDTRFRLFFERRTALTSYQDIAASKTIDLHGGQSYPKGAVLSSVGVLDYRYLSAYPQLTTDARHATKAQKGFCPEIRHTASPRSR